MAALPMEGTEHQGSVDVPGMKRGETAAFESAVRLLTPRLLGVARRIIGEAGAEDAVQEAWLVAFQRIGEFEERARFETWMTRIVVNQSISTHRRRAREQEKDSGDVPDPTADWFDERGRWRDDLNIAGGDAPDHLLEAEALRDCLDLGIDALPEQQRRVVVLRELEQWDAESVCNELGISASNVRVLLHRGRMKLMRIVERYRRTGRC
jgi:RNA polymerase sigma-70 factor (ECF subfamily)